MQHHDAEAVVDAVRAMLAAGDHAGAQARLDILIDHAAGERLQGRVDAAKSILQVIVVAFPGHPSAAHDLGVLHAELGDDAEALPLFRRALQNAPGQRQIIRNLSQVLLRRGDLDEAWNLAQEVLQRSPGDSFGLSLAQVIAVERGAETEANPLIEYSRLVRTSRPAPASGYPDMKRFNEALVLEVMQSDGLRHDPNDRTTRAGRQSGALFPAKRGALHALQSLITNAMSDYSKALGPEPGHPFLAQQPSRVGLHGWATVLDHGGYQEPHLHPSGWLSGVYYPQLPGVTTDADGSRAGWLVFGEPNSIFHAKAEHLTHWIAPWEGMLVLFPSYMHHRTEPFMGSTERISIAFDLVPHTGGKQNGA